MIEVSTTGSSPSMDDILKKMSQIDVLLLLDEIGAKGVDALARATPIRTGLTAYSWSYSVDATIGKYVITWSNNHDDEDGVPIAILIQFGHGTGTGGWVEGRDYVNPAIQPLFDEFVNQIWEEVRNA